MVQFASYLRCILCKTRLIFPRINGPIAYLWKISCCFERASIWLYWEVHFQISSFLGIKRMWGKKGEYLGEEELAQMASAQPSVWQLPCLIPECGLKSLF